MAPRGQVVRIILEGVMWVIEVIVVVAVVVGTIKLIGM